MAASGENEAELVSGKYNPAIQVRPPQERESCGVFALCVESERHED